MKLYMYPDEKGRTLMAPNLNRYTGSI